MSIVTERGPIETTTPSTEGVRREGDTTIIELAKPYLIQVKGAQLLALPHLKRGGVGIADPLSHRSVLMMPGKNEALVFDESAVDYGESGAPSPTRPIRTAGVPVVTFDESGFGVYDKETLPPDHEQIGPIFTFDRHEEVPVLNIAYQGPVEPVQGLKPADRITAPTIRGTVINPLDIVASFATPPFSGPDGQPLSRMESYATYYLSRFNDMPSNPTQEF